MKQCVLAVLICLVSPLTVLAQEPTQELGLRGGMDGTSVKESYSAGEVYYLHNLPYALELTPGTSIYTRFDAGVGYLHANSQTGSWVAVGVDAVLSTAGGLLELEAGFRPAWLSRDEFGQDDFGGAVQFSSHAGVALNFGRFVVNYRFQHLSNAGLYEENPGINLHLFGIAARF